MLAALLQYDGLVYAAGLTYVDAQAGVDTTPQSAFELANTSMLTLGLWDLRVFAANGTIYEATASETVPEITQTLTGLTASANYDVYVVYWIDAAANWTIRAGFSSGTGPIYNKLGPTETLPDLIAGTFASSAAWTVPPPDNPTGSNDALGLFRESNRTMLMGKVGTAAAAGDGTIPVFINGGASVVSGQRAWLDGLAYVEAGATVFLGATVNRSTGAVSIVNATDSPFTIKSYTVTSASGSLNSTTWTKIGADSDGDAWSVVAPAAPDTSTTMLTETEDLPPLVTGTELSAVVGQLNLGNAWRRTPIFQDVVVNLTLSDDTIVTITPQYTGTAPKLGDLDLDGSVDITEDYATLMSNLHTPVPGGSTLAEAYLMGDLTGDGIINYADFSAFRFAYDADNGAGAFAAAVPEPAGWTLSACAAIAGAFGWGVRRRRDAKHAACTVGHATIEGSEKSHVRDAHSQEIRGMRNVHEWRGFVPALIAGAGIFLALAASSAAPVTGWVKDPLNNGGSPTVPLSGEATDSPVLGDGVTNLSADNVVIYAPIPLTTLAIGEQITLSGTITMVGVAQRDQVFRWGLFKDDGAVPDTGGWLGYIGESGNGGNTGPLWSRNPAGTDFLGNVTHMSITNNRGVSIGTAKNPLPGPFPANGTYDFVLTVGKYDNQIQAVASGSLIGGGGYSQVWDQATESNVTRVINSFDRVSLLSASVSDADQMAFSGIDVAVSAIVRRNCRSSSTRARPASFACSTAPVSPTILPTTRSTAPAVRSIRRPGTASTIGRAATRSESVGRRRAEAPRTSFPRGTCRRC